jgi:transposase-like protein
MPAGKGEGVLMREQRRFSVAFRGQVVEELLSGTTSLAQLSRRHNVSGGLIVYWKKRYEEGKLGQQDLSTERGLRSRIEQLEGMVGRLALENDLLKRAVAYTARRRREHSSPITAKSLAASKEAAK